MTTVSNDQGNILQISYKTLLEKNPSIAVSCKCMDRNTRDISGDSEAMLLFFSCSKFSVRVYNTSHILQGKHLRSIDRKNTTIMS